FSDAKWRDRAERHLYHDGGHRDLSVVDRESAQGMAGTQARLRSALCTGNGCAAAFDRTCAAADAGIAAGSAACNDICAQPGMVRRQRSDRTDWYWFLLLPEQ